jgi:hypothetical protein
MNASYEVRDGYLYVQAMGEFNLPSARRILSKSVKKACHHSFHAILGDITRVTGLDAEQTSMVAQFDLGVAAARSIPREFRLAVLVTWEQLPVALFGENVMINRGATAKMTTDLCDALRWLHLKPFNKPAGSESCLTDH